MSKFVLNKLPSKNSSQKLLEAIAVPYPKDAVRLISKYDGMVEFIDNPSLLANILFLQEAVKSSNIEGTIATISDVLDYDVGSKISDQIILADVEEIKNYEDALKYAMEEIEKNNYRFSCKIFKEIQSILLNNSRGKDKLRGAFKEKQNYIGNKLDKKITYIPVSPILTNDYMENLVEFINHNHKEIEPLVKIALIHAQFELIHPFEDGNGRVGRIIVPILLKKYGLIENHFFYISYYLAKNRSKYIDALENISSKQDWAGWVNFFVGAIEKQSEVLILMLKEINEIARETRRKIQELKTTFAVLIVDFLFEKIKFDTAYFIKKTGINPSTARVLLKEMVDKKIISIEESGSGTRSHIYKFDALYELIRKIEE